MIWWEGLTHSTRVRPMQELTTEPYLFFAFYVAVPSWLGFQFSWMPRFCASVVGGKCARVNHALFVRFVQLVLGCALLSSGVLSGFPVFLLGKWSRWLPNVRHLLNILPSHTKPWSLPFIKWRDNKNFTTRLVKTWEVWNTFTFGSRPTNFRLHTGIWKSKRKKCTPFDGWDKSQHSF